MCPASTCAIETQYCVSLNLCHMISSSVLSIILGHAEIQYWGSFNLCHMLSTSVTSINLCYRDPILCQPHPVPYAKHKCHQHLPGPETKNRSVTRSKRVNPYTGWANTVTRFNLSWRYNKILRMFPRGCVLKAASA